MLYQLQSLHPHILCTWPVQRNLSAIIISMRIFFIAICVLFGISAQPVSAQLDVQQLVNPELLLVLQPDFPRPGEPVEVTINDYSGGVYGSSITWVYNGEVIDEAENKRSVIIQTGAIGTVDRIQAILNKPSGGREVLTNTIRPVYLDLIVEPQTRVPDFYLGRSLPSIKSMVNVTALVNDGRFRNDLVYTWRLNRVVLEGGPIRSQNQVSFEMPMGNESILSVQVTEPNGQVLARRAVFLPSVSPELRFHEVSSLYGVNPRAIDEEYAIVGNSGTLRAEPYHLDSRVYNNPDIAQWEINNRENNNTGSNPYEVTIQQLGVSGTSNLSFHVRDTTQVLQGIESGIQIRF